MNLKLRFALLFTLSVAAILASSAIAIYLLNQKYREEDYYERVKTEAIQFHSTLSNVSDPIKVTPDQLVEVLHSSTLYDERIMIIDTNRNIIYKLPDTLSTKISLYTLDKIKTGKEYRWYGDKRFQNVAIYFPEEGHIIITAGFDRTGLAKLRKLKLILSLVFVVGLLLSAFVSFLFVREAFRPLTSLSLQLKNTSFQDLTRRLEVKDTRDEISEITENFNAMLERLDKAYSFQKSFVYHASHELRTPLATMLSETESALSKQMDDEEYKKTLLSLKEEQQELIELTNSLLLISQYEEMAFAQEWPNLRIDEILYDTVSQAKRFFPEMLTEINFSSLPENEDDLAIHGNESLLRSAFFNLVKNAFFYSTDRKVTVTIDIGDIGITVHIENGGPQPGSEEVEKLMQPFYRGRNALKSKGFGLGLAIIHRIITIHKGKISYQALSGNINRFSVTLLKSNTGMGT